MMAVPNGLFLSAASVPVDYSPDEQPSHGMRWLPASRGISMKARRAARDQGDLLN
jgi:hypothetical protein